MPAVLLAVLAGATPASASTAPSITFDRPCYQDNGTATRAQFRADQLTPGARLPVSLDGQVFGEVPVKADGTVRATFAVPAHAQAEAESTHQLSLTDTDGTVVSQTFLASSVAASFSPTRGDPKTMKVRFTAAGMNIVRRSTVYVHYVAPNGRNKLTVKLGKAKGACGHLVSSRRRLFPFTPRSGHWMLQVDTQQT